MNTENGEKVENAEHRKNLNPFATDEDDDSGDEGDFSIGEIEGEDVKAVETEEKDLKENVGIPTSTSPSSLPSLVSVSIPPLLAHVLPSSSSFSHSTSTTGIGRVGFPSLWPFGGSPTAKEREKRNGEEFRGDSANKDDLQGNDSDDSDGSDGAFDGERGRRLSATTEAKRRTSLEDDDEEDGVVHVGMAEVDLREGVGKEAEEGDGELVEIQHAEMHGVDGSK